MEVVKCGGEDLNSVARDEFQESHAVQEREKLAQLETRIATT